MSTLQKNCITIGKTCPHPNPLKRIQPISTNQSKLWPLKTSDTPSRALTLKKWLTILSVEVGRRCVERLRVCRAVTTFPHGRAPPPGCELMSNSHVTRSLKRTSQARASTALSTPKFWPDPALGQCHGSSPYCIMIMIHDSGQVGSGQVLSSPPRRTCYLYMYRA